MPRTTKPVSRSVYTQIGALAPCDPRTVERYYNVRKPMTGVAEGAIRRAIATLGLSDPRSPEARKGA